MNLIVSLTVAVSLIICGARLNLVSFDLSSIQDSIYLSEDQSSSQTDNDSAFIDENGTYQDDEGNLVIVIPEGYEMGGIDDND